ncbi:hypothetical protein BGW39_004097 [Mortierella sp. 14UC]|nr:hypothetical protein BGW39_004097 [Mortierella sp. 14UC]
MFKERAQSSKDEKHTQASYGAELSVNHLSINNPLGNKPAMPLNSNADNHSESNPVAIKSQKTSKPRKWTNWAKNQTCHPSIFLRPRTLQDVVEVVKSAKAQQKKIRCVAGGYTWSSASVVHEDGVLVFVDKMTQIFSPVHLEGQG